MIRARKEGRRSNLFQRRQIVSAAHTGHEVEKDQDEQQNADDSVQDLILQRFFDIGFSARPGMRRIDGPELVRDNKCHRVVRL